MWSIAGLTGFSRSRRISDGDLPGRDQSMRREGRRQPGCSPSPEALSLKFSSNDLAERHSRITSAYRLGTVHSAKKILQPLRNRRVGRLDSMQRKGSRDPSGRCHALIASCSFQVLVNVVWQFNSPAHPSISPTLSLVDFIASETVCSPIYRCVSSSGVSICGTVLNWNKRTRWLSSRITVTPVL